MPTNDLWNKMANFGYGDGPEPEWGPKIPYEDVQMVFTQLANATGGMTAANAKIRLDLTGDAATEFDDLAASVAAINPANADTKRSRWLSVAGELYACAAQAERGLPENTITSGEMMRRRIRDHINHTTIGGAGTCVGTLAAANQ